MTSKNLSEILQNFFENLFEIQGTRSMRHKLRGMSEEVIMTDSTYVPEMVRDGIFEYPQQLLPYRAT